MSPQNVVVDRAVLEPKVDVPEATEMHAISSRLIICHILHAVSVTVTYGTRLLGLGI